MEKMSVTIQLDKNDNLADVGQLTLMIMSDLNDRGYALISASVDGLEVFGSGKFNQDFFENLEFRRKVCEK